MTIEGQTASLARRKEITGKIVELLEISDATISTGSTVLSEFLGRIVTALGGDSGDYPNAYRKLEFALNAVGEFYDPSNDSSENRGSTGGSTITNSGYRKLLRGLAKEPQCFIFNVAEHPVSAAYEDVLGESYGFGRSVTGGKSVLAAGAGSRILFYRTGKSTVEPKMAFFAHAFISHVEPSGDTAFRVYYDGYEEFESPVLSRDVNIRHWNRQHAMAEITFGTFARIVAAGFPGRDEEGYSATVGEGELHTSLTLTPIPASVAIENAAKRALASVVPVETPVETFRVSIEMPEQLPRGLGVVHESSLPSLGEQVLEEADGMKVSRARGSGRRDLDKYIERRAVFVATRYMVSKGWRLARDCQTLGVGFDLLFVKAAERRHVEVKGIQGDAVVFNLTGKEWARVLEDPSFVLIAVTGVLDQGAMTVHVLDRTRLVAAHRVVERFRMTVSLAETLTPE